jgi:hypothetical protein
MKDMHKVCFEKHVMEKQKHAKRVTKSARTRCRDEKYAGRAGPPDCVEVEAGTQAECGAEKEEDIVGTEVEKGNEKDESVGGWDIVGGEEHLHSPDSCHPPCTSHRLARCTVS